MNWKKAISFGVLIWIIMFVIVSAFVGFKIYGLIAIQVVAAIITGALSMILAKKLKIDNVGLALAYGVSWLVVGVILDFIVTTKFNPTVFSSWPYWLSYALVLLAPLFTIKKGSGAATPPTPTIPTM